MEINFLSVFLGALGAWAFGMLWYSPVLFSKAWQVETGMTDDKVKSGNMALTFGLSFVSMFVISFGLHFLILSHPAEEMTWMHGAFHGGLSGFMFLAMAVGINYLYQQKSFKLWLIDAGYMVALLAISGAIQGSMH